jgi:hypothetical protein
MSFAMKRMRYTHGLMRHHSFAALAAVVSMLCASFDAFGAAVGSDSFAGAPTISGNFSVEILTTTKDFTTEAGEPKHSPFSTGRSAWWKWTATTNGFCTLETIRTDQFVDTGIAVYTGTALNALTRVAANDNVPGAFTSKVTFFATAGSTYRIAVDSTGLFAVEEVLLQLRFLPAKPFRLIGNWRSSSQDFALGGNGLLSLSITGSGAVTGFLIKGANRFPIKTVRSIDGYVQYSIPQPITASNPQGAPITLLVDLLFVGDFLLNPGTFTVVDGTGVQGMGIASEVGSFTAANPPNQAGTYNVNLTFGTNTGQGFGIVKIGPTGAVRFRGVTGDGQPFATSSSLSSEHYVPIHQSLQKGGGFLNGRFFAMNNGDSFVTSNCDFRRAAVPTSAFYPNGFVSEVTAAGSRYVKPAPKQRAAGLLEATNGAGKLRTIDAPGELGTLTKMLTFSTANKFTFASAARKPVLRLSPATGLVSGSINEPAGSTRIIRGLLSNDGGFRVRGFVGGRARTAGFIVEP